MSIPFRKIMHLVLGGFLVLLGVAGIILPVLNGTIFLIVGLIIISFENPYVEEKLFTLTQKNKMVHHLYIKLEKVVRKFFRK